MCYMQLKGVYIDKAVALQLVNNTQLKVCEGGYIYLVGGVRVGEEFVERVAQAALDGYIATRAAQQTVPWVFGVLCVVGCGHQSASLL